MKKYFVLTIFFAFSLMFSNNLMAEINFEKNNEHYQNLCESEKSYNANKSTCIEYEKYLSKKASKSENVEKNLKQALEETKTDISKLSEVIKESNALIKEKETLISKTKKEIILTKKEIKTLEKELLDRLEIAQELSNENFVIDFIMSSENLEDFLLKLEGVSAMNAANSDLVDDLSFKHNKLDKKEKLLKKETKQLKETKKLNKEVLKEYHQKEAELFTKLEKEIKEQASYNSFLDNLTYDDLDSLNNDEELSEELDSKETTETKQDQKNDNSNQDSNNKTEQTKEESKPKEKSKSKKSTKKKTNTKLRIPTNHGYISAVAWYYPASFGGGWHPGMDIAASTGTKIYAPGSGVELMRYNGYTGYGKYVVTAHQVGKDTYTFIFGHMSKFGSSSSTISKNKIIGYVGSTGYSTGPHVHVEIFKHKNKSLSKVVNTYKNNRDIYFGLGYNSTGNCSNVCRIAPQSYYGLSYGQSF